jgi:hypothetical protein
MSFKTRLEGTQGKKLQKYGVFWSTMAHPLWIEMQVVAAGGQWTKKNGETAGEGNFFHYKQAMAHMWPHFHQHRWFDLLLKEWLDRTYLGIIGPKDSGKSAGMAVILLTDYYIFPLNTLVLFSSTTKESLENRVWGEVKMRHKEAKSLFSWLPGNLIEGRQRIVTDHRDDCDEGRDLRRGCCGVPMKKGNPTVGMDSIIGIKQKRKRWFIDELQTIPKSAIDATANFIQNGSDCKVAGAGNADDITSTLGVFCEPHSSVGGWDGGIDQTPKTKSWKTRFDNGSCVQFPGSDSPNFDVKIGEPVPYPFLMTRDRMDRDALTWGKEDWHYLMFNEGRFPRGQGSRRVITRQLCIKHGAMKEPVWKNTIRTKIAALDAAYRSVGGDRCVFITLEFGDEGIIEDSSMDPLQSLIDQASPVDPKRQIIALTSLSIIPIKGNEFESPEDQIVMFTKMNCETQGIPPRNFFFDSGMRTSLVTAFSRLWSVDVNSIDCGGRPSERAVSDSIDVKACDYYSKKITELWYSVRMIIEAKQFRGMTEDVMLEGCSREWKTVGANRIEVETKSDMKEKTGKSPDLFDALCVGCEGARQRGFGIRRLANKESVYDDGKWKGELKRKALSMVTSKQLNYAA